VRELARCCLLVAVLGAGLVNWLAGGPALGADDILTHLVADEVGYDEEFGLYVARGKVEVQRGDKIVMADILTYNERTKMVTASGHVAMLLPSGDTLFGNYVDVSDDFGDGIVHGFRALLRDKSRLAAAQARRIGGKTMELTDAVYTPCLPCKTDPSRQPVWQVKTRKAVRDETAQTITYYNAWIEMFGVPVFWTPYFKHAEPGVKRQSGLLSPKVRVSSGKSGIQVSQPYFMTLGPDKDLTIAPILRVDGEPGELAGVGDVEYRQRLRDGAFRLEMSGTVEDRFGDDNQSIVKKDRLRGHVEGDGLFELNRDWRWGFNSKATTDKSYLSQYHLGSPDWLESQLWAEGFFGRSHFDARAYNFQTTEETDDIARNLQFSDSLAPVVLPAIDYSFVGEPGRFGSYWGLDVSTANLMRRQERDSLRMSLKPSWTLPYTGVIGDIYELKLSLQGDLYVVDDVDRDSNDVDPGSSGDFNGVTGRAFPQASLKWRYPFVRSDATVTQIFQPIAQLVLAPDCCNTGKIPNEDGRQFVLDDSRVFDADRLAGYDRVDSGSRFDYGAEWTGYFAGGGSANLFLGQSLRFLGDGQAFTEETGIGDDLSDLVGRASLSLNSWLTTSYRFAADIDDGAMRQQTFSISGGPPVLRASFGYRDVNRQSPQEDVRQISAGLSSEFLDGWSARTSASYDLKRDSFLVIGGGLGYQDECFGLTLEASYSPRRGNIRESEDDFTAFIEFRFTNLGAIGGGL
jgi:LPS-assembly protein